MTLAEENEARKKTIGSLVEQVREVYKTEQTELQRWMREHLDYPPRGWNDSWRRTIDKLSEEIDRHVGQILTLHDRGSYIEKVSIEPHEFALGKRCILESI